jgi:hypothetical protein
MKAPDEGCKGQWRRNHSNSSDKHQVRSSKKATPQKTSTTCPTDISKVSNKNSRDGGKHNPTTKKQQQEPSTKMDRLHP